MNEKTIQQRYDHITSLLSKRHLREAQSELRDLLASGGEWQLGSRLEQSATAYTYLLQYMRQGVDDPGRIKMYQRLLADTWEVADQARMRLLDATSTRYHIGLRHAWTEPDRPSGQALSALRHRLEQTSTSNNSTAVHKTDWDSATANGVVQEGPTIAPNEPLFHDQETHGTPQSDQVGDNVLRNDQARTVHEPTTNSPATHHADQISSKAEQPAAQPDSKAHEEAQNDLVASLWTNCGWTAQEASEARDMVMGSELSAIDLCLMVSGVTLSLIECWDPHKVLWLTDACQHPNLEVSCRALTGLALALLIHPHRATLYPTLTARLSLLQDHDQLAQRLNMIYLQMLRSKDTERVSRKVRDEILPEVAKNLNDLRRRKFDLDNLTDDPNPDWEEVLGQTFAGNLIKEFEEMWRSGADLGMSTFSDMKGFPFFSQPAGWVRPFDVNYSQLPDWLHDGSPGSNLIQVALSNIEYLCDSDKYSFCFLLDSMPADQRKIALDRLIPPESDTSDIDNLIEARRTRAQRSADSVCRWYIMDLYRLLRISPWQTDLHDIFQGPINLHRDPYLGPMLSHRPSLLKDVAQLLLKQKLYTELTDVCALLIEFGQADANTYRQQGYALQCQGKPGPAAEAYLRADLMEADHPWTIRQLATCHRRLRHYDQALEYYRHLQRLQPGNCQVLNLIGGCLAEQERYDEALPYYYQVDLLHDEGSPRAWRAIAWCSLATGRTDQAVKYYDRLLAEPQPTADDLLNAGHAAWLGGQLNHAVELYNRAAAQSDDPKWFAEAFEKDRPFLQEHGISPDDFSLVLDMVE